MKYDVTLVREFTVSIDAADLEAAQSQARSVVAVFPGEARLLSVEVAKEKAGVVSPPAKKPRRQNRRRS